MDRAPRVGNDQTIEPAEQLAAYADKSDKSDKRDEQSIAAEAAWASVERIADAGNVKASAALALDATGAHEEAERLRAEVKGSVLEDWLPAMRRWACAADRAGELPAADRWLLEGADAAAANGYRPVPGGWIETEARARCCVKHADRPLADGDTLYCPECRAEADAADASGTRTAAPVVSEAPRRPAPHAWRCICLSTERRYREQWGDWVCAREQCGLIVPSPEERP